ncbi:MAG: glycosyltransferase family 4 protein [Candidatus Microsaccharimonas sp.]
MNLLFDARYTRTDYHDGISRYSAELGNALLNLPQAKSGELTVQFLICNYQQKQWFPKNANFIKIHVPTSAKEPFTALILNKHKPDVVYSPMQTIGTLGRKYKSVLTLHDMIYYRHNTPPKFLPAPVRAGWWLYHQSYWPQRLVLKGADLITTVSETSAKDIQNARMTQHAPVVVYNAPQQFKTTPVLASGDIQNIVYMGSFMPYKNVEILIKGMEWLPGRTLHLLSRINATRRQELQALIPEGANVTFHNGVSDEEYEKLLANNALLATASLDEGYGIPVAEAMAMGVPVVASNIPIFYEVGGDSVSYFEARSPKAFAEAVKKLDDKRLRDAQIARGSAHIATFNWNTSAQVLYDALKTLL